MKFITLTKAGERYRLERDANGKVIAEWGFDGLNRTYERNPNGQVIEVTSPLHKATYSYTPLGQLSSVNYDDGNYEWFTYDKLGRITQAENPTSQTLWEYDVLGRIIAETQNGHRITHQYNAYGNRTAMESSLGAKLQHTYNEWGECVRTEVNQQVQTQAQTQATTPIALWQASYGYNRMGWEVARFLQGDVVQHTDYDLAGRVVTQRTDKAHSSGGYELSRRQYVWNPANQLKAIIYNGKHTSFDYDAVGNLASATYNQTETIYKVPDVVGNLYRTPDRKGYTYSEGGRLLECPDWKYVYDLEGQLIEKISKKQQLKRFSLIVEEDEKPATLRWFYSWNANGSLKSVANNDRVHFAFEYDALGRRTAKINLSSKRIKRFLWDGNVPLHEWEYDLSERPNLSRDKDNLLVYDKEEPVTDNLITWVFDENSFVPAAKLVGDKSYSILTDHLGTPYEAYDEEGKKVWARELDLYGNAIAGDSSFIPFLYQGQYYDEEIGLAYNRFRYYSPESGTYISQDPIRLAGGLAFYGYVFDCNGGVDIFGLHIAVATYTNSNGITGEVGSFPSIKNISHSEPQILEQMGEQKGGHLHIFSKGPNGDDTFTFFRKKGSSSSYPAGPLPPCSQCDALLYNHSKENDMLITYHWKDKLGNEHIRVYHPDGSVFENGIDISSKYH